MSEPIDERRIWATFVELVEELHPALDYHDVLKLEVIPGTSGPEFTIRYREREVGDRPRRIEESITVPRTVLYNYQEENKR